MDRNIATSSKSAPLSKKLLLGFASASAVAIVGAAGLAAAHPGSSSSSVTPPKTKDDCKNGGWRALGFPNQGQCVSYYNHAVLGHGYGHGNH